MLIFSTPMRHALVRAAVLSGALLATAAFPGVASAQTEQIIYTNFGPGNTFDGEDPAVFSGRFSPIEVQLTQAMQFTALSNASGIVSVDLALRTGYVEDGELPRVTVGLYADNGSDLPSATALFTTTREDIGTDPGVYTFSSAEGVNLSANTLYWVVASAGDTFVGAWYRNNQGVVGNQTVAFGGGSFEEATAVTLSAFSVRAVGAVAAAPEPGSLALIAPGLLPVVGCVIRRRRASGRG